MYYLGESKGRAAAPQTPNASSLAGGVKGDVSWLLGDQSWPGKISGPKPAEENLPACLFHVFSLPLSLSLHVSVQLPFYFYTGRERNVQCAALGMIRWMNSSLLGADYEDMVAFECVTVANEGCRCLEGCYGEVLGDCVFQQGYGGRCDVCAGVRVYVGASVRMQREWVGGVGWVWII